MQLSLVRSSAESSRAPWTIALGWLRRHDANLAATRRATRAAIVMPAMFAIGDKVIQNALVSTFAAFGAFAMLLMVEFGGSMRARVQAQLSLIVAGAVLICIATLASRSTWAATVVMAVVGFAILFSGIVSSVLASSSTALLLALILPITLPGSASTIPDRLAGWGLAGGASLLAITLMWPAPARDALRAPAVAVCRALAGRLRAEVAYILQTGTAEQLSAAIGRADETVAALQRLFYATPYRLTGLSTSARIVVRLVDELGWLHAVLAQSPLLSSGVPPSELPRNEPALTVKYEAIAILDAGADLLTDPDADEEALHHAVERLLLARKQIERHAAVERPVGRSAHAPEQEYLDALDPSFRAQELTFAAAIIASTIELTAAAERRGWIDRQLGRQPSGAGSALAAAQKRATAHLERHSQCGCRTACAGAAGLGACHVRRQRERRSARLLGHPRHVVGAALQCVEHRPERTACRCRHRRGIRRRRAARRSYRHRAGRVVATAPAGDPLRGPRTSDHLVHRRPGRLHRCVADPRQHHRTDRMECRARAHRRHRHRLCRQPRRRAAVLAAGRRAGVGARAGRGVFGERWLPALGGRLRGFTLRRFSGGGRASGRGEPCGGGSCTAFG